MTPSSRAFAARRPFARRLALAAALTVCASRWAPAALTSPAPDGMTAVRITDTNGCGGGDCVDALRGDSGRSTDAHAGHDSMFVVVGLRGSPTLFRYDKATDQVEKLGPVLGPRGPRATEPASGWHFSARRPATLYVAAGSSLLRYDVVTRSIQPVFDAAAELGDVRLQRASSSDDDNVHAALVLDPGGRTAGRCLAYREDQRRFFHQQAAGSLLSCGVDGTGRWLTIRERAGSAGVDVRIVDLETGVETLVAGAQEKDGVTDTSTDVRSSGEWDRTGAYYLWVGSAGDRRDALLFRVPAAPRTEANAVTGPAITSRAAEAPDATGTVLAAAPAPAALTPPAALTGAAPDPLRLPVATTAHVPLTAAYDALGVPSLAAGASYQDPTTNVKVYKLTSSAFPTANANWGHDYSEGGDEVSLPYNGETRAVLVRRNGSGWYLVDFTPGVGVGSARALAGSLAPFTDLAFTFSNNPATPHYAYVSGGSTIRRIDIRTLTEAPGDGWPVTGETSAMWFHQAENDSFFVWMRGANGTTVVGYEPATGTRKAYTNAGLNEPRIDRAGRYVGISMTTPGNGLVVWDWLTNTVAWTTPGDPGIPFAHNASLRRRWMTVDWNMSYPPQFAAFSADVANSARRVGGPANANLVYGNGNWIQSPANLDDQWALFSNYGGLRPAQSYWLAPGAMVLITSNGERRTLAHPYNTSTNYTYYSFAKLSSDGRYVLFTSDMNGAGRSDVFLAELPTGTADTTPPTVGVTAPAPGAAVSGTVTVSATAADDVGVVGVRFERDGAPFGAEDTSAPFSAPWDTTLTPNGSHALTAVARDAAGNTTVSAPVTVVASNDATAPVLSSVAASGISASGATITWTTDEPADSQVDYGPSAAYGATSAPDSALVLAHTRVLAGLSSGTVYHYRVRSRDAAGNLSLSGDFTFTTAAAPPPSTGPIAFWKLDEGTGGTAADSSGNGHVGTLMNGASWAAGRSGQALALDGVDDHVTAAHAAALDGFPLTVSVWFQTSTTGGLRGLVNKYVAGSMNGYQIFFNGTDLCAWYFQDGASHVYDGTGCTLRTPGYNDGAWHQAVLAVDSSGGWLYVDGTLRASRPWTGTPGATTTPQEIRLGHYPGVASGHWAGNIDEVRLYDRALSAVEVAQLYGEIPPPGDTVPPVLSGVGAGAATSESATISWTTSEPADSQVEYGTTSTYGSATPLDPALVLSRSQTLSGLVAGTLYHYRVRSRDAAGNLSVSADFTFTTAADPAAGLVALWRLDEGSGTTAADSSGKGHPASLFNGAAWTNGRRGKAVSLDGSNDYARAAHAADLNAFPLTVSVWFQTRATNGQRGLVNKYSAGSSNGYQLFLNGGKLCAWYFRSSANAVYDGSSCPLKVTGLNDGVWHHAALVVDAAGGRLYVDGVLRASRAWTGAAGATSTTQPVHLGRYPGVSGSSGYLPGLVDEVRLYNRALSAAEIVQLSVEPLP